jgi:hypothetical protein
VPPLRLEARRWLVSSEASESDISPTTFEEQIMLKLMLSTKDHVTLTGAYDADGQPLTIDLEVLFTGTYRCQISVDAPRSVLIKTTPPEPVEHNTLPSVGRYDLGATVRVAGVVYRLVTEPQRNNERKRVWMQVK